jgi:hypothetical protein
MSNDPSVPMLVRWYVARIRPRTRGKPAKWDDAWVSGTIRFGWEVLIAGVGLLALCVFLPDDGRRWLLVAFGLITAAVGLWHIRNARAVCDQALQLERDRKG